MDIGDVAKKTGLPVSKLRYYETQGLIHSTGRRGLRRQFETGVLDKLALITLGQQVGFSLGEIKTLFAQERIQIDREQLLRKADELDETIKNLQTMSRGLRHAANCPAPSHLECPKFRRIMRLASRKNVTKKAMGC